MTSPARPGACTNISVVIPTYNRGPVLLDTVNHLLKLDVVASEIIVVDQTLSYPREIESQLFSWQSSKKIIWIKQQQPSVVAAMNIGLLKANQKYVLFLDDDIKPESNLILEYKNFLENNKVKLVAGRVVQPWDDPKGIQLSPGDPFSFNSLAQAEAEEFIGANFLVEKECAISIGGFDENFVGTAHNYEREYSDRCICAGHKILYHADAVVYHLKASVGGIRSYGHFLKTIRPHQSVGAYYYCLRGQRVKNRSSRILRRMLERITTKIHLKAPWWIPLTLIGDIAGLIWAVGLYFSGQKLLGKNSRIQD